MSKNAFDREYLKWLWQLDASDADSVWEAVEDQLDLAETWDRINTELDHVKPQRKRIVPLPFLRIMEIAAAILILVLIPLTYLKQQDENSSVRTLSHAEKAHVPDETLAPSGEALTTSGEALTPSGEAITPSGEALASSGEALASSGAALASSGEVLSSPGKTASPFAEAAPLHTGTAHSPGETIASPAGTVLLPDGTVPAPEKTDPSPGRTVIRNPEPVITSLTGISTGDKTGLIASNIETTVPSKKTSAPFFRIHDAGLMYSYKNTWLLNYETRNGLNPAKLGNTLPTFHHDLGITSTLVLKEKHDIGLELLLMSETGQNYQQYINASYVNRKITLNYFKLQAWYMWKHRKIPGSTIAGVYFARLGMAEEIQGDLKFSVRDDYRNHDYGLVLGYRLDVPLFNNIVMYPGIRFNYNLMNIFEGHDGTANIFKTTNNFTAGVNVAFTYGFH